jgi:ferredoxin
MTRVQIAGAEGSLEAADGASLLHVLQAAGHPIATSCGGVATCALCRVTVKSGREHLSPITEAELTHLGSVAKILGLRLACQARCHGAGEVTLEVPEVEDVAARKARKAERLRQNRAPDRGPRR